MDENNGKLSRILAIYTRLLNEEVVNKSQEAVRYGVNEKSIQRDINEIRNFLSNEARDTDGVIREVIYDKEEKGYRLKERHKLTNSEILAIGKILLDSRAFTKDEMESMIQRLVKCCVPEENRELVEDLLQNEMFHYIELEHRTVFIDKLWTIGQAIQKQQYIEIKYQGIQGSTVKTRKLRPLAIMFSEYYFYLTAFIDDEKVKENFNVLDDAFPTIYRIDRIQNLKILDETFRIKYADRFQEGEFRKRIQFMYGGKLRRVRFEYTGYSAEAIKDKLPTAKIIEKETLPDGKRKVYSVTAEVFGDGIDMWLRSQGDNVKILKS